ncbi:hypothetical protein V7161_12920 [Neobacillus drentensis]
MTLRIGGIEFIGEYHRFIGEFPVLSANSTTLSANFPFYQRIAQSNHL